MLSFLIVYLMLLATESPTFNNMLKKKIGYNEAYSLKTPEDSKKLYKKWAKTYDKEFAVNSNYLSPKKICIYFNKYSRKTDTPILDVGAGTGLVGEFLYKKGNKKIIGIDISSEMLNEAKLKGCYSELIEADITKKIPLKNDSIGAIVSAGTFTHGHVGADAFDELLRITKPGGLFVLSINSKVFIKGGFKKKFLKIKNKISCPIFKEFNAHGKNKKFNEIKIFASIFRKN
ncbi:MAG: Ubiquinone/menaquinone biosynthesis C-methyltransferase UbiE [Alphaproteobacteria bacterium MarineAlpha5_Bin5]|nr:MAG: Ubiquinone/menaquinone biosynthesis C-methyltransferase UbiE [Alphaproteobacteria bacterium MarineAlpha5_Bin4]PPR49543.1 MAG: Ubiquinone/menaquinone biosynthesis C-methyltransferase UbiE [Alphaproteobacteria bacterium MarineAlpha5_Bin5]|tara:strand:- start:3525 stop:4217 length:693 start_codon:yes stop_codon:yes gene_type:complete